MEYPGDITKLKDMIDKPDAFNAAGKDMFGWCAIHKFASWNKVDLLEVILNPGILSPADVNDTSNPDGFSVVHCCVDNGAIQSLNLLLRDSRVVRDANDKKGRSPLQLAREKGDHRFVDLLEKTKV